MRHMRCFRAATLLPRLCMLMPVPAQAEVKIEANRCGCAQLSD